VIESYIFGRMVIGGQTFNSDLILFPDSTVSSWWRKTGHRLCLSDLEMIFKKTPEVIIIGTGFFGLMKVEDEVKKYTEQKGIKLIIEKTKEASQLFNELSTQKRVVGAFHLTC